MNSKTTMPITEGRARLYEIAENVSKKGTKYVLTERGRPTLVIMSLAEYEGWQETIALLKDFPNLTQELAEASADFDKNGGVDLADVLRKYGHNKVATRYEKRVSSKVHKRRA